VTKEFENVMLKHSDKELVEILTKYRDDYQPDAIIAAEIELKRRNLTIDKSKIIKYDISNNTVQLDTLTKRNKISNKRLSFYITLVYVGLGTIYSFIYWSSWNPIGLNDTFGMILFCIFLPTSFISISILFTVRESAFYILIAQTITFALVWAFVYAMTILCRKEKTVSEHT